MDISIPRKVERRGHKPRIVFIDSSSTHSGLKFALANFLQNKQSLMRQPQQGYHSSALGSRNRFEPGWKVRLTERQIDIIPNPSYLGYKCLWLREQKDLLRMENVNSIYPAMVENLDDNPIKQFAAPLCSFISKPRWQLKRARNF